MPSMNIKKASKLMARASLHNNLAKAETEADDLKEKLAAAEAEVDRLKKEIDKQEAGGEGEAEEVTARLNYAKIYARGNQSIK